MSFFIVHFRDFLILKVKVFSFSNHLLVILISSLVLLTHAVCKILQVDLCSLTITFQGNDISILLLHFPFYTHAPLV